MSWAGFAAIDWSGARGARHWGIAVALARPGRSAPKLVAPPGGTWSRSAVAAWIAALRGRWLVGCDFSFAPPFVARGAYFPGLAAPDSAAALWRWIDTLAGDEPDLGAANLVHGPLRAHFWLGAADGPKAAAMHLRACEARFNAAGGGKPSSIYDGMGAAQVAKASLSGMRLLARLDGQAAVWPFGVCGAGVTLVEIYTRLFLRLAGGRGTKLRVAGQVDRALAALGSGATGLAADTPLSDHATDVLVAAAGLRRLAHAPDVWRPAGLTPGIAATEGWTFGVT